MKQINVKSVETDLYLSLHYAALKNKVSMSEYLRQAAREKLEREPEDIRERVAYLVNETVR